MQVSVVIPCYNSESSIIRTLSSVFSQTTAIHEVIVIDDGSTDRSCQMIQDFRKQHNAKNLKLIKQANAGPAAARNHGISIAEGDWIAFLDSDDIWLPQKIEIQQDYLLQNPDIVLLGESLAKKTNSPTLQHVTFKNLLARNYFITSSVIVKKDSLPEVPFDLHKKYSEDYKLWLEIGFHHACAILNIPLVEYSRGNDNQQNNLSSRLWKMEKGELDNYYYCYRKKYINIFFWVSFSVFSFIKYLRRSILKYIK